MKCSSPSPILLLTACCIFLLACKKETYTPRPGPPGVNAGNDQVVLLPVTEAILAGEAWPHFGISTISSNKWIQVDGPSTANIESPDKYISRISGLEKGTYLFEQTAQDNFGQSARDTVTVYVLEDTIAGKTYYFDNLTWSLGRDWQQDLYFVHTPPRPDLFFPNGRPMDVHIRYEGSADWIAVPRDYGIERNYFLDSTNFTLTIIDWRDVSLTKLQNQSAVVRVSFR
jgi:hypothetical protein